MPPDPGEAGRNIRVVVEYEGTSYVGWERQKNGISIQEVLEAAIRLITGETVVVHGSGRTDAGVHAEGQVANFRIAKKIHLFKLQDGLNAVLPEDVAVTGIEEADLDFHARFSATSKVYRYTVVNARSPSPLRRRTAHHVRHDLDLERIRAAAKRLVGRHDFRAFAREADRKKSTVRDLIRLDLDQDGAVLTFTFEASGFLYNMVRIAVGTLLEVGRGKRSPDEVAGLLETGTRKHAGPTAPARGLSLIEVRYPAKEPRALTGETARR